MKNSLIIILLFVAVFAQAQEKKEVKDMNWKECEERLSKGSDGLTKEEMSICKKKVFAEIKRQKFEELKKRELDPNYKPEPPQERQKTFQKLFQEDPEAANKLIMERIRENEEKERLQPIKEKYEGKHIDIELVASFDDEKEFQKYLKKEQKRPHQFPIRGIRHKGKGRQFIDENGNVLREVKKTSGKLSKKEREDLIPIFERQIKHLKTPVRKRDVKIIQDHIKNLPTIFGTSWKTQQGFLIETMRYMDVSAPWGKLSYDEYNENHNYSSLYFSTIYSRANIYDYNGVHKFTLEGDGAAYISPSKNYIVALGLVFDSNVPNIRVTFYDIAGNLMRTLYVGTVYPEDPFGASSVMFALNGKYVVLDPSHTFHLLNNKGEVLWEKKNGEPGYSRPILVTNNGDVLTETGQWIDKNGIVISKVEIPIHHLRPDVAIIDAEKELMLMMEGISPVTAPCFIMDLRIKKVVEAVPIEFFPSIAVNCIDNRFLKALGKGHPHKAIYLYKVRFKK